MIIYPAMDLMNGVCVRLARGRFDARTTYPASPNFALHDFALTGASWAHVVDLDGARDGTPRQHDLLTELDDGSSLLLQVAGGFRKANEVERMMATGVGRVVIGSLAVSDPDAVRGFIDAHGGERITLALDVNVVNGEPIVATRGWTQESGLSLWAVAERFPNAQHILVTDISRDGMMGGPNLELVAEAVRRLPHVQVQASGGVSSLHDLQALRDAGAAGAIVGKALWEGRFTLSDAIHAGA